MTTFIKLLSDAIVCLIDNPKDLEAVCCSVDVINGLSG